ncbi:MAG: hypothetical protein ACYC5F_00835, partial [Thermoleophilia bacterium]
MTASKERISEAFSSVVMLGTSLNIIVKAGSSIMTRPNGREIDPEKVKYQLDMLVAAIWKNAEEQLRARKKADQQT